MKRKSWFVPALVLLCTAALAAPSSALTMRDGSVVCETAVSAGKEADYASALSVGETFSVGGITYQVDGTLATVVGYSGDIAEDCVIPASVTNGAASYPVTTLGESAFYNCSKIRSVTLPDSIVRIEASAFQGCTNLTEITIPAGVSSIGENVFMECYALKNINVDKANTGYHSVDGVLFNTNEMILMQYPLGSSRTEYTAPEGTKIVGENAFFEAGALTSVTLPDTAVEIRDNAFEECHALEKIDFGAGMEQIECAFTECTALKEMNFPATLKSFSTCWGMGSLTAYHVAEGCENFSSDENGVLFQGTTLLAYPAAAPATSYTVPAGVTVIATQAFWDAENLAEVIMQEGLLEIGDGAFTSGGLVSITVPDSVTEIGSYAFQTNHKLVSLNLGNGITKLPSGMVSNCANLPEITIPASVTSIRDNAFQGCRSLANIYVEEGSKTFASVDGVLYNAEKSKLMLFPAAKKDAVLNLPAEVTSVTYGALSGIASLERITVEEGNTVYFAQDGVLFENNKDEEENAVVILHTYPQAKTTAEYTVPDGVDIIAEKAFEDHRYIAAIDLNDVTEIREDGFGNTYALEKADLGSVKIIGQSGFIGSGLRSITIPASTTEIDNQAFDYCDNLDHIIFEGATPPKGMWMLCPESENVRYVYVPVGAQVAYKAALTGKVNPGAMIVEGTYIPEETLTQKIDALNGTSTISEVNQVAAGVVRLTAEDMAELSNKAISVVENFFKQIHKSTLSAEVISDKVEGLIADGLALASGLVEQQAANGTVSGSVTLSVTNKTQETGDVLSLEFAFSVNDEQMQPKTPIIITATIPEGTDLSSLELVHITDSGREEIIPFTSDGQQATFRADSFSTYTFRSKDHGVSYKLNSGVASANVFLAGYDAESNQLLSLESFEVTKNGFQEYRPQDGIVYKAFVLNADTLKNVGSATIRK